MRINLLLFVWIGLLGSVVRSGSHSDAAKSSPTTTELSSCFNGNYRVEFNNLMRSQTLSRPRRLLFTQEQYEELVKQLTVSVEKGDLQAVRETISNCLEFQLGTGLVSELLNLSYGAKHALLSEYLLELMPQARKWDLLTLESVKGVLFDPKAGEVDFEREKWMKMWIWKYVGQPPWRRLLLKAVEEDKAMAVQFLLQLEREGLLNLVPVFNEAMHRASELGFINTLEVLLDNGETAPADEHNVIKCFQTAAKNGHWRIIHLLLVKRSSILKVTGSSVTCFQKPLLFSLFHGHEQVVKKLLLMVLESDPTFSLDLSQPFEKSLLLAGIYGDSASGIRQRLEMLFSLVKRVNSNGSARRLIIETAIAQNDHSLIDFMGKRLMREEDIERGGVYRVAEFKRDEIKFLQEATLNATKRGQTEIVKRLLLFLFLNAYKKTDDTGNAFRPSSTTLSYLNLQGNCLKAAARYNRPQIVKLIIDSFYHNTTAPPSSSSQDGIPLIQQEPTMNRTIQHFSEALLAASTAGHSTIVKLILVLASKKFPLANLLDRDENFQPLFRALLISIHGLSLTREGDNLISGANVSSSTSNLSNVMLCYALLKKAFLESINQGRSFSSFFRLGKKNPRLLLLDQMENLYLILPGQKARIDQLISALKKVL